MLTYIENGGRITLGLLGLGADGHVASLFSKRDLTRATDRYSIAVPLDSGPDRVSVTPKLLREIDSLVFLVAGQEKAGVFDRILNDPESTIAGQAVRGTSDTEVWYAPRGPDTLR